MHLSPRGASEPAELQHADVQQKQQQQQQEFGQPGHSQEQSHAQRSQHAAQQGVLRSFTRQLRHGAVQPCRRVDDHDGVRGVIRPEPRHAAHLTHTQREEIINNNTIFYKFWEKCVKSIYSLS